MGSEGACHTPAPELIPLQHPEEGSTSSPKFRCLKGLNLLVGSNSMITQVTNRHTKKWLAHHISPMISLTR